MRLHHFTSLENWRKIRTSGVLWAHSESHVHHRQHGPPVLWLTTRETGDGIGLEPGVMQMQLRDWRDRHDEIDKRRVRITVEVSKTFTHRWLDWAPRHKCDPQWVATVRKAVEFAGSFRVHTRDVPRERWVEVVDTYEEGRALSIAPTPQQLGFRPLRRG